MSKYDVAIIGGGPTGLTLALLCSSIGKRCILYRFKLKSQGDVIELHVQHLENFKSTDLEYI